MKTASPAKPPHPCIIGLTGGIGSGKSTVADLFAARGAGIIDTDQVAHTLTAAGGAAMPAITSQFGSAMQAADGSLNRPAMRALVFAEPAHKRALEGILHPMIRAACLDALQQCTAPYALLVVPLLIETAHYLPLCQRILVVDCTPEIQLQRVIARSRLSKEEASRIIASQIDRNQRIAAAHDILDNSGPLDTLPARIETLHQRYLQLAAKPNQNP